MEGIYTIASTASSVTYGNIASAIKEMLLTKFPYQYFKYTSISSEIAYRNIKRQLGYNSKDEIAKREKPYLLIRPQFQAMNSDMYLYDVPMTKNIDNLEAGIDRRHLFPIINDTENNYKLMYKLNRDRFEFDITITVSSLIQQIDAYKSMLNMFVWDRSYAMPTALEAMLPDDITQYIGKLAHIDIYDSESKNIPIYLNHVNKFSQYPITHKMKNSSATNEFFMYYNNNVIVTLTDLSIEEGVKKNMADDYYNINFHVTTEFNLPGLFILMGTNPSYATFKADIVSKNPDSTSDFVPMFTLNNLYSRYTSMLDGYRLYTTSMIEMCPDANTKMDTVDMSVLFEKDYIDLIKRMNTSNCSVDTLMRIIFIKDSTELVRDIDWKIDWNSMILTVFRADKYATYRILVYTNNIKINEELVISRDANAADKNSV